MSPARCWRVPGIAVCGTISPPMAAPSRFGLAATCSSVPAPARKSRSYNDALVHERQPPEHLRHCEDDVHVADGQEFLLARRHPLIAGRGEALRTMSIPAAVVRDGRLSALLTAIAMPAQHRRAALDERPFSAA